MGLESGTDESLEYFNKQTTVEQNRNAVSLLHRLGIDPTVSLINFFYKTDLDELRKNLSFLLSLNVNFLQGLLNRFIVYHGTPMAKKLADLGKIKGFFPEYTYDFEDTKTEIVYSIVQKSSRIFSFNRQQS